MPPVPFLPFNDARHCPLCYPFRRSVGGRLKTGQWWSIQNQPLNWLVTGLELCWQEAFWWWDSNSGGMFLRVISESAERANANRTQNAVTAPGAEIGQSKF
jgi:hypothetical protein